MRRFDGKTALITGGARGIGLACARRLAEEGAHVVIGDVDEDAARSAASDINALVGDVTVNQKQVGAAHVAGEGSADAAHEHGAELQLSGPVAVARAVTCDVTDRVSVQRAVEAAAEGGGLHVVISNVGIASPVPFAETDEGEWERQLDPTLTGSMRVIRAALPYLLDAPGGGAVVATSSVNGLIACGGVAYSAAKAGVISAVRSLAAEYGPHARGTVGATAAGSASTLWPPAPPRPGRGRGRMLSGR